MARGDLEVGVHKAPANIGLVWAEELTASVNDAEHGLLNLSGINALRAFPGRGIRIFGARTVSSDPDWRFINVRRLLMMIEEALDEGLQWVVFEPNDDVTRTKVTLAIRSLLTSVWERGGLIGRTPDDAFFVKCSDVNNPPSERGNGRLLAEVGVAASQPFEFVVLRVGRVNNALEVDEAGIVGVPR
jgi:phage tail sheath protein FI